LIATVSVRDRVKTMNDLPGAFDQLAERVEALERRVDALEHPSAAARSLPALEASAAQTAQAVETPSFVLAGGVFPVLGKAMLGIAGAYLLRAVTESGSLPRLAVAVIAIAYAILWLVGAARASEWFASTAYACTSALILAPMLWELTLRFRVLPAAAAAGVLALFVCAASALSWKRNLASVFWVANVTAVLVALALSIATHEMAPFLAVLLLMVAICEFAAARNRELNVRTLVAPAADLAVWALIYIYSSPPAAHENYPSVGTATLLAPGLALFLIFGVSVALKTAVKRGKITVFETAQTMIAFLLAASGLLYFEPRWGATALGVLCLALCAASYATAFVLFGRISEQRNRQVFAAWSATLFLAGSLLSLPPFLAAASLGVAAIVATVLGVRLSRPTLEFHGLVYLLAAAAASGLLEYGFRALAGTLAGAPSPGVLLVSACAFFCYAVGKSRQAESGQRQFLHIASASVALCTAVALLVEGLMSVTALGVNPGAPHLAFIRTLVLCAAALALAYSGAHWRRMELTRIGYATLVLVVLKLVLEDLRHGHLEFIAASIFLFAITLIALPRLARMRPRV
jgi:hypothetical protein